MNILLDLFLTFMRIGAFTFGGGYAMLSLIQKEVVDNKKWASEEEVLDYYAVAQCTPGVIAVNTATFIGHKKGGIPGAIVATLGVILPSLVIIIVIASVLTAFMEYKIVSHIFGGIRACVAVLIINAVITMGKKALIDKLCVLIGVVSLAVSVIFPSVSPIFIVIGAAVVGIFSRSRKEAKK